MSWQWLHKWVSRLNARRRSRSFPRRRNHPFALPGLEALEDRTVPSAVVATNALAGPLRQAILSSGVSPEQNAATANQPAPAPQSIDVQNQCTTGPDDPEDCQANTPQTVNGAFLWGMNQSYTPSSSFTLAPGLTYLTPAEVANRPYSFMDVQQEQSPTCAFDATLSAVARTEFPLESGIVQEGNLPNGDVEFNVRLFAPNGQVVWEPIDFNGVVTPEDLNCVNPQDYWACLYQRAYITLTSANGEDYQSANVAYETLTGQSATDLNLQDPNAVYNIENALQNGAPVVAATRTGPSLILDSSGVISSHCYTVLGIEVEDPSDIYVTLRNPWAPGHRPQHVSATIRRCVQQSTGRKQRGRHQHPVEHVHQRLHRRPHRQLARSGLQRSSAAAGVQ